MNCVSLVSLYYMFFFLVGVGGEPGHPTFASTGLCCVVGLLSSCYLFCLSFVFSILSCSLGEPLLCHPGLFYTEISPVRELELELSDRCGCSLNSASAWPPGWVIQGRAVRLRSKVRSGSGRPSALPVSG